MFNLKNFVNYKKLVLTKKPRRYRNLFKEVYNLKAKNILEIGVYNGNHAQKMIETSQIFHNPKDINYFGFDLFELISESEIKSEFSKQPPTMQHVKGKLDGTNSNINLFLGYTQDTLPIFIDKFDKELDLIFVDGGHAEETIESDWNNVKRLMTKNTVVIFDDYYNNNEVEMKGAGCQKLINSLDKSKFKIEIFSEEDRFQKEWGVLKVKMAKVTLA